MKSLLLVAALSTASLSALAQGMNMDHSSHHGETAKPPASATSNASELAEGEVRRVDRDQKKITLRHGEIKSLGMPPMTMVFQLADPAWIDQYKVGDKVRFDVEQINGAYTVVRMEKAP